MPSKYDENTEARAVSLVREHRDDYDSEWAAMKAIAGRLGMNVETLRTWVRRAEVDAGKAAGISSEKSRVFCAGPVSAFEAERVEGAVGRVLAHRGIAGDARVRLTAANCADGLTLVQVNLRVCDTPVRVQAVTAGMDGLAPALVRLDRQIVRLRGPWRPRPWPDRTRRMLTAPEDAVVTRRKAFALQRVTPLQAVAVMDAMDYDVHLFTDVETEEDAVVYRAGPSGLRLARQRRMYPPGWSWASSRSAPPVPLIVNSLPTPTLSEAAAVVRVREHGLRFLFFTDPATRRGQLLYPRYDGNLGLITPIGEANKGAS